MTGSPRAGWWQRWAVSRGQSGAAQDVERRAILTPYWIGAREGRGVNFRRRLSSSLDRVRLYPSIVAASSASAAMHDLALAQSLFLIVVGQGPGIIVACEVLEAAGSS